MPLLSVDWHFCHLAAIEVIFGGSGGGGGGGFADDDLLIDDEEAVVAWSTFCGRLSCTSSEMCRLCNLIFSLHTTQGELSCAGACLPACTSYQVTFA